MLTYATSVTVIVIELKIWNGVRLQIKLEEQERLLLQARMAALQNQINPHFLFNTLNSVSSLVRIAPDTARELIIKLATILRRLLHSSDAFVPLQEEIDFIDNYLDIEVVRFGRDKLKVIKELDPESLEVMVPSMLLQPLVENSIKHGLSSKIDGGSIFLRSQVSNSHVTIEVEDDGVGMASVQLFDAVGRLIHEHDGSAMLRKPPGCSLLVFPSEAVFRVMRELDIVGRIGVYKIVALEGNGFHVRARERPVTEHVAVRREVARVTNTCIPAKRHVEFARAVEPAQAVEARSIQIVEECRCFQTRAFSTRQERVETFPLLVEERFVVLHRNVKSQTLLKPSIEIDQVWIRVVQQRASRHQSERDREPAAERLHESPMCMGFPNGLKVRHLPSLAAGPFQSRPERCRPLNGRHVCRQFNPTSCQGRSRWSRHLTFVLVVTRPFCNLQNFRRSSLGL